MTDNPLLQKFETIADPDHRELFFELANLAGWEFSADRFHSLSDFFNALRAEGKSIPKRPDHVPTVLRQRIKDFPDGPIMQICQQLTPKNTSFEEVQSWTLLRLFASATKARRSNTLRRRKSKREKAHEGMIADVMRKRRNEPTW